MKTTRMPVMFVGHGTPMNALQDTVFTQGWADAGSRFESELPYPKAIVMISAHWLSKGTTLITAAEKPPINYDVYNFPPEMYQQQYPAPGSPELARQVSELLNPKFTTEFDTEWGFDHGCWVVLQRMFPKADIPVIQVSIDITQSMESLFELGKSLRPLREQGVLLMASGNIVHNTQIMVRDRSLPAYDFALEFDNLIRDYIDRGDFQSVIEFQKLGDLARMAHPGYDHFLPLIVLLGAVDEEDHIEYFNDAIEYRSISMRSILFQDQAA